MDRYVQGDPIAITFNKNNVKDNVRNNFDTECLPILKIEDIITLLSLLSRNLTICLFRKLNYLLLRIK